MHLLNGSILGTGTLTLNASNFDMQNGTVSANLAGTAGILKSTAGTVLLSGSNSYSGGTTINDGTLQMGAVNTMPAGGAVIVNSPGNFQPANFSQSVGNFSGDGSTMLGQASTLTITLANDSTYVGVISDSGTGSAVTLNGVTHTFILTGVNTYIGGTTINSGILSLQGASSDLSPVGTVNIAATTPGATLDISSSANAYQAIGDLTGGVDGIVTLGNNQLRFGNSDGVTTFPGVIEDTGSGSVVKKKFGTARLVQHEYLCRRNGCLQRNIEHHRKHPQFHSRLREYERNIRYCRSSAFNDP